MSNKQPTCACFINPQWQPNPWPWPDSYYWPYLYYNKNEANNISLTEDEQLILSLLTQAFEKFALLDAKHPDDDNEFKDAIHRAQEKIAVRVARRVNPEVWKTYE
jgi:hypothetical protein